MAPNSTDNIYMFDSHIATVPPATTMQRILNVVRPKKPTVNAVHLRGVIAARAGPRGIGFGAVKEQLEVAFKESSPITIGLHNAPGLIARRV